MRTQRIILSIVHFSSPALFILSLLVTLVF
jgi:hypothetical protein